MIGLNGGVLCSMFRRDSSGEPRKLALSGKGEFDILTPSRQRSPDGVYAYSHVYHGNSAKPEGARTARRKDLVYSGWPIHYSG